jgi:hypothetical protein
LVSQYDDDELTSVAGDGPQTFRFINGESLGEDGNFFDYSSNVLLLEERDFQRVEEDRISYLNSKRGGSFPPSVNCIQRKVGTPKGIFRANRQRDIKGVGYAF